MKRTIQLEAQDFVGNESGTHTVSMWLKLPAKTEQFRFGPHHGTDALQAKDITVTTDWQQFDSTGTGYLP